MVGMRPTIICNKKQQLDYWPTLLKLEITILVKKSLHPLSTVLKIAVTSCNSSEHHSPALSHLGSLIHVQLAEAQTKNK